MAYPFERVRSNLNQAKKHQSKFLGRISHLVDLCLGKLPKGEPAKDPLSSRGFLFEQLEPRILLSADVLGIPPMPAGDLAPSEVLVLSMEEPAAPTIDLSSLSLLHDGSPAAAVIDKAGGSDADSAASEADLSVGSAQTDAKMDELYPVSQSAQAGAMKLVIQPDAQRLNAQTTDGGNSSSEGNFELGATTINSIGGENSGSINGQQNLDDMAVTTSTLDPASSGVTLSNVGQISSVMPQSFIDPAFDEFPGSEQAIRDGLNALKGFGDTLDNFDLIGTTLPYLDKTIGSVLDIGGTLKSAILDPVLKYFDELGTPLYD